jgi:hypothetical protein
MVFEAHEQIDSFCLFDCERLEQAIGVAAQCGHLHPSQRDTDDAR